MGVVHEGTVCPMEYLSGPNLAYTENIERRTYASVNCASHDDVIKMETFSA